MAVPSPFPLTSPSKGEPASPARDKSALRAEGLRRRKAFARSLAPGVRAEFEAALARLVLPHLTGARVIAVYHPLKDEISPATILSGLGDLQRHAIPWFADRDAHFLWREGPASAPGPWGVLQPAANAEALAPDVVVVPLVLADRGGTRIGHGKGHYDRALAHLREAGPVFTIGIAWETQIVDEAIPADPWDVPLNAIATPKEWIACG